MPSLLRPDLYYKQVVIRLYLVKMTVILGRRGFHGGSDGKASACNAGDPGSIPELGRSIEEGKATHSSNLAWKIPWTEESRGLPPMGLQSRTQLSD